VSFSAEQDDVASLDRDLGSERLESLEVEVDGAVSDHATAGQGDFGRLLAAEQGPMTQTEARILRTIS